MKGKNGLAFIIRITIAVIVAADLVSAFMLHQVTEQSDKGNFLLTVSIIGTVLLIIEAVMFQNQTKKNIARMSTMISRTEKDSLLNFPAPAVIIDDTDCIVWYNRLFGKKVYTEEEAYGIDIKEIANIDMEKAFSPEGDLVCLSKRFYETKAIHNSNSATLSMVYFNDITDFVELQYETRQSHKSIIIINIDNFDDLMVNVRESEKAHVVVEIEKLIEDFVDGTTAVSKKISNDRFYVFMEERHLAEIIKNRFKILEQARKIQVSARTNLTLSIGVGREGNNLAESEKLAKQALELCQGRGGDQAAVRENGEFKFFGGTTSSSDRNNKVKVRMVAKAMLERIQSHERVLIMGHKYADLDSVGAGTGLCCAIRPFVKEAYVVVDPETNLSKSLITYMNENEMANYYIPPDKALEKVDENTLLIVVDTHNPKLVESSEILDRAGEVIVIDHHRRMVNGIEPTVMSYLEPGSSSASELVTDLIEYFGDNAKLTVHAAEALLAGIMLDTKNFVMKTGAGTFESAAYLKKQGADTIEVKKLFANSIETYHEKSTLINSAKIYRKCAIASTSDAFSNIRIAAAQAADEMLGIAGVNASFVMYETNGTVNISGRSMGAFNVQIVMEALGGGGHLTMAACQLKTTLSDANDKLIEAIDNYIRENT